MYRKFQIDLLPYAEQIFDLEFIEDINFEVSIGISWEFSKAITGDRETKPEPSFPENFEIEINDFDVIEVPKRANNLEIKNKIIQLTILYVGDEIAKDLYQGQPELFNE